MIRKLPILDFLAESDTLLLDVRSPAEFEQGHIPGAISFPLFNNEERAEIGTLYKQVGKEEAVLKGLEMVGPRLCQMVKEAYSLTNAHRKVRIYCWRGGMRSGSVAWLLNTAGLSVTLLDGGYKTWRNYVQEVMRRDLAYFVLGGYTGSGKTEILQMLRESGKQIIDLEGLASHKGSSFGTIGMKPQPSQEHFENLLSAEILKQNPLLPVWLEDESRMIGKITLPESFWLKKNNSHVFFLEVDKGTRIKRLVQEYAIVENTILQDAILRIQKKLGGLRTKEALQSLEEQTFDTVADIMLDYYDRAYIKGLNSLKVKEKTHLCQFSGSMESTIQYLIEEVDKLSKREVSQL